MLLLRGVIDNDDIMGNILDCAVNYDLLVVLIIGRHPMPVRLVGLLLGLRMPLLLIRIPRLLRVIELLGRIHGIELAGLILLVVHAGHLGGHLVIRTPHVVWLQVLVVLQGCGEHVVISGDTRLVHQIAVHQHVVWHEELVVDLVGGVDARALALLQAD